MKTTICNPPGAGSSVCTERHATRTAEHLRLMTHPQPRAGFTLTEMMTAMAIFSLVTTAVVYTHIFGLQLFNISATKLSASANARAALNAVREDIRSAKVLYVGNGTAQSFTRAATNQPRQGNAVQIFPTTNTASYVRYFLDPNSQNLMRVTSASPNPTVVARFLTNRITFAAEDYAGNVLTNDQNNRVIRMSLEFYQWEFPVAHAGAGAYYDYYRLQTRVTRRTIE